MTSEQLVRHISDLAQQLEERRKHAESYTRDALEDRILRCKDMQRGVQLLQEQHELQCEDSRQRVESEKRRQLYFDAEMQHVALKKELVELEILKIKRELNL